MKRVMYQVFDQAVLHDIWLDVAQTLEERVGWSPVYWVAMGNMKNEAQARFPHAVVHDKVEAMRGVTPPDLTGVDPAPLGAFQLERFARYERVFMSMADRLDGPVPVTFRERRRMFRRQLAYWMGAFGTLRPDLVVFQSSPHCLFDYVIYAVAIETGVDVRLFAQSSLLGFMLTKRRIEDIPIGLADALENRLTELAGADSRGNSEVAADVRAYLASLRGAYEQAAPWYMESRNHGGPDQPEHAVKALWHPSRMWKGLTSPRKWRTYSRNLQLIALAKARGGGQMTISWLSRLARMGDPGAPEDSRGQVLNAYNGSFENARLTHSEWRAWEEQAVARKAELEAAYEAIAESVDFDSPYVYLPLHYQPERTTCPEAGVFEDQIAMASLVARCLPPGWKLYVREHPSQFRGRPFYGEQGRTADFYADLAALPATSVVQLSIDPFVMIDEARAVATATGTAGWEALARGVPCLLFGHAWYKACPGVSFVQTWEEVARALSDVDAGRSVDPILVEAFALAVSDVGVLGDANGSLPSGIEVTHERQVEAVVRGLLNGLDARAV